MLPTIHRLEVNLEKDYEEKQPDLQERANYVSYLHHELPRLVRSQLESAVNSQLQGLEPTLRSQLEDIIKISLEQLSANYESSWSTGNASDRDENTILATVPMCLHVPPMLPEAEHEDNDDNDVENLPELHKDIDYATFIQNPDQPPTPGNVNSYGQSNDTIAGLLSLYQLDRRV